MAVLRDLEAACFDESEEREEEEEQQRFDSKTNVLYVANKNAKALRTALESENLLDKTYRMIKAQDTPALESSVGHIAVPVKEEALTCVSRSVKKPSWVHLVVAAGKQQVPLSTAVMGSNNKHRSK